MAATGVLSRVLPGAVPGALAPLVHLELPHPPRWLRRLAVLGGEDVSERLRLSRADAGMLATLRKGIVGTAGAAELGYRHGAETAGDILLARAALIGGRPLSTWRDDALRGAAARLPVSAADLMPGLSGPALGQRLAELESRWIASGFTLSRAALLGHA
jgi:poly(A) polymerase